MKSKPLYAENDLFNDSWDDAYGEFEMGAYSYPASEILFNVDLNAYETESQDFIRDLPRALNGKE